MIIYSKKLVVWTLDQLELLNLICHIACVVSEPVRRRVIAQRMMDAAARVVKEWCEFKL
jgi:hypothetical protein